MSTHLENGSIFSREFATFFKYHTQVRFKYGHFGQVPRAAFFKEIFFCNFSTILNFAPQGRIRVYVHFSEKFLNINFQYLKTKKYRYNYSSLPRAPLSVNSPLHALNSFKHGGNVGSHRRYHYLPIFMVFFCTTFFS